MIFRAGTVIQDKDEQGEEEDEKDERTRGAGPSPSKGAGMFVCSLAAGIVGGVLSDWSCPETDCSAFRISHISHPLTLS